MENENKKAIFRESTCGECAWGLYRGDEDNITCRRVCFVSDEEKNILIGVVKDDAPACPAFVSIKDE